MLRRVGRSGERERGREKKGGLEGWEEIEHAGWKVAAGLYAQNKQMVGVDECGGCMAGGEAAHTV